MASAVFKGHLSIDKLKTKPELGSNKYIHKDIPDYPKNVKFQTSQVSHVTTTAGLDGILSSNGFRHFEKENYFSWWRLNFEDSNIEEAEHHYLDREVPDRSEEIGHQSPFLKTFTTSPVFVKGSRYGSYRFNFELQELMQMFSRSVL
ncbi:hypothetical protein DPEC_G00243380 [Dallia pectoralis]|uniref:Uncharacterized protein n=1 Tax=Dallia pectoralis TaxID=75939 RepID=A0ACC2FVR2_DALPE|nr:hypothetical protein DPEC_G00243380 [Dallia pectoralis]